MHAAIRAADAAWAPASRSLVLYLDGLEGSRGDMEHNAGLSEAFLGLEYRLIDGEWPMAIAFNHRTSYLYELPGASDRHLFDEDGPDASMMSLGGSLFRDFGREDRWYGEAGSTSVEEQVVHRQCAAAALFHRDARLPIHQQPAPRVGAVDLVAGEEIRVVGEQALQARSLPVVPQTGRRRA